MLDWLRHLQRRAIGRFIGRRMQQQCHDGVPARRCDDSAIRINTTGYRNLARGRSGELPAGAGIPCHWKKGVFRSKLEGWPLAGDLLLFF
jgi:hypothetical protein